MAKFKVYFDGKCRVCSREIDFYRTKAGSSDLEWVDITELGFDASAEGLDPSRVTQVFHVRDESGKLTTGVDAFVEIWKRIPEMRSWVSLSQAPGAMPLMRLGYRLFARVRPYLPRKGGAGDGCADGYCERGSRG